MLRKEDKQVKDGKRRAAKGRPRQKDCRLDEESERSLHCTWGCQTDTCRTCSTMLRSVSRALGPAGPPPRHGLFEISWPAWSYSIAHCTQAMLQIKLVTLQSDKIASLDQEKFRVLLAQQLQAILAVGQAVETLNIV